MRRTAVLISVLLSLLMASEARSQRFGPDDGGGWGGVTAGWGSISCDECGVRESGVGFGLVMGLSIRDNFLIGLALTGVAADYRRVQRALSTSHGRDGVATLGPIMRFYPSANSGLFLRGGLGLGMTSINHPDVAFHLSPRFGLGGVVGLGWDIAIGSGDLAFTPVVNGGWVSASEQTWSFIQVMLGLTFH